MKLYILSLIQSVEPDFSDSVPLNMKNVALQRLSVKGSSLSLTVSSPTWPPLGFSFAGSK